MLGEPQTAVAQSPGLDATYELFVCMAILDAYRAQFLATRDMADVFTFINGYPNKNKKNHASEL